MLAVLGEHCVAMFSCKPIQELTIILFEFLHRNVYRKVLSYIEETLWEAWKIHSYQDQLGFRSDHSRKSTYFYINSFKLNPIRSVRCAVYNV